MKSKKFTQPGTFSIAIILPLLFLFTNRLIKAGLTNSPEFYILIFVTVTLLICLLLFYKLTIIVDSKTVSFKLGIGLIGKSYNISNIKSCTPVSNSIFYGIGIRMLSNGWLYNVSGLKAIELQFNSKKSIIRIGINQPDKISQLIQSLIKGEEITTDKIEKSTNKKIYLFWITTFLSVAALLIIPNITETKIDFDKNQFKIKGVYGMTISYSEIEQTDTISNIPRISIRTNGYAFGKTLIGNFKFTDKSNSKLFIKKGFTPYVIIKSQGHVPILH